MKGKKRKKWKEMKRKIPDQRSEESKKEKIGGKQNNSRSIKETKKKNRRSLDQINFRRGKWPTTKGKPISKWFFLCDFHSRSLPTGDVPPHINKEEKTETPSFLSKNTTLEKIFWFDRKSRQGGFTSIGLQKKFFMWIFTLLEVLNT